MSKTVHHTPFVNVTYHDDLLTQDYGVNTIAAAPAAPSVFTTRIKGQLYAADGVTQNWGHTTS